MKFLIAEAIHFVFERSMSLFMYAIFIGSIPLWKDGMWEYGVAYVVVGAIMDTAGRHFIEKYMKSLQAK